MFVIVSIGNHLNKRNKIMDKIEEMNKVVESMIHLCEIRGQLDEASNAKTEKRLEQLERRYAELQKTVVPA